MNKSIIIAFLLLSCLFGGCSNDDDDDEVNLVFKESELKNIKGWKYYIDGKYTIYIEHLKTNENYPSVIAGDAICPNKHFKHSDNNYLIPYLNFGGFIYCNECQSSYNVIDGTSFGNNENDGKVKVYNISYDSDSKTYTIK